MIPYSVFLMKNPLKADEPAKAYANGQVREKLSTDKFVAHVASHNSVFSKGTIKGVLSDIACCLREQLLAGNKVHLEGLGTFGFTISSKGADSMDKFTSANIKEINIIFTPDADLENLIDDAVFEPVASRAGQAAALKAEKFNQTSVDLKQKQQ